MAERIQCLLIRLFCIVGPETVETVAAVSEGKNTYHAEVRTGGDGGDGGSVVIKADRNLGSLTNLSGHRHWNADRGGHGKGNLRTGRTGVDTVIMVPPGTLVMDAQHGHLLKDLQNHEDSVIVAKAGWGGRGNKRFASSTHQAPRECEPGAEGEYREVIPGIEVNRRCGTHW